MSRLHQAVDVLSQATVEAFVGLYTQTIADQAERLDQFTRMAVHEWRQPLSTVTIGVRLLREVEMEPARLQRTLATVERNVQHLAALTRKLEAIARVRSNGDNAVVQTVSVATVVQEAALATIFERFARAHTDHVELVHVSGIGLGLSIVEDCVRAMGGSIEVRSVETQGSTFTVTLPTAHA